MVGFVQPDTTMNDAYMTVSDALLDDLVFLQAHAVEPTCAAACVALARSIVAIAQSEINYARHVQP